MRHAILLALAAGAAFAAAGAAQAQITTAQQSALRASCRSDFMAHCSGVTPGGKDALMCLQKNVGSLSGPCQTAVRATMPAPAAAKAEPVPQTMAPAPAAPPPPAPAAAAAPPSAPTTAITTAPPPKPAVAAPPPARHIIKPAAAAPAPAAAAPAPPPPAAAPDPAKLKALKFTCRADFRRLCKNVPEGPAAFACLQSHSARLSPNCKTSLADLAASMPAGGPMPPATPVMVKPAPVAHPPKAPVADTAVVLRACKLDVIRHCRGAGLGGGKMLACLTAHEDSLTFRCRAAMKVSAPLH